MRDDAVTPAVTLDEFDPRPGAALSPEDRASVLLTRVIDGEALAADWNEMAEFARLHPGIWDGVWSRLAAMQADREALSMVLADAVRVAEGVELPGPGAGDAGEVDAVQGPFAIRREPLRRGVRAWGGWAAAAAVVAVWFFGGLGDGLPLGDRWPGGQGSEGAVQSASMDPADLFERYLEAGRREGTVLGELNEPEVISAEPTPSGDRLEILILRSIVERRLVDELERVRHDELGRPTVVTVPVRGSGVVRVRHEF